jgi:hypothetical protein
LTRWVSRKCERPDGFCLICNETTFLQDQRISEAKLSIPALLQDEIGIHRRRIDWAWHSSKQSCLSELGYMNTPCGRSGASNGPDNVEERATEAEVLKCFSSMTCMFESLNELHVR